MDPQSTTPQTAKASLAPIIPPMFRKPDGTCGHGCGRVPERADHSVCRACQETLDTARDRRICEEKRAELIEQVRRAPIWDELPKMPWARVDGDAYVQRAPRIFQAAARGWKRENGNVLMLGEPGMWKTGTSVALAHRLRDEAVASIQELDPARVYRARGHWLTRAMWVPAQDLSLARRHHSLGSEAPMVARAKGASLLIIDELGIQAAGDRDQLIFEIVDHRYRSQLPTIGTSGMSVAEFQAAHGGGLWRRFTEQGVGRVLLASEGKARVRAV